MHKNIISFSNRSCDTLDYSKAGTKATTVRMYICERLTIPWNDPTEGGGFTIKPNSTLE